MIHIAYSSEAIKSVARRPYILYSCAGVKKELREKCVLYEGRHGVKYDPMHGCVITVGEVKPLIFQCILLNPRG